MPAKRNRKPAIPSVAPNKRRRSERPTAAEKKAINGSLRLACYAGNKTAVDAAISNGADDWTGALVAACRNNHAGIAAQILQKRPIRIEDAMTAACDAGHFSMMDMILRQGFGDGKISGHLLECAAYAGRLSVVRYLVDKVEKYDIPVALAMAGGSGRLAVVEFLLSTGAGMEDYGLRFAAAAEQMLDIYHFRNVKRTAGYNANHPKIVRLLIANGAGDDADNAYDALQAAVKHPVPNDEIIAMLLRTTVTRIDDAFDIDRDAALILRLLSTTDLPRNVFAAVDGIQAVFDSADRIADDVAVGLVFIGFPTVLRPIVAGYCINLADDFQHTTPDRPTIVVGVSNVDRLRSGSDRMA